MKVGNSAGRIVLVSGAQQLDVEEASDGRFSSDPQRIFERWNEFRDWAHGPISREWTPFDEQPLQAPVPQPRQVFAIALNYRDHAREAGVDLPEHPSVFTKFPSCISGPFDTVRLPSNRADWEAELVVAIGAETHNVSKDEAWSVVAGLMVGQDISERRVQLRPPNPQFSLGKSYPTFGPIGPLLVTPDELPDRENLRLRGYVNDELVQESQTSNLIFTIGDLIEYISSIVVMYPGDLIFTGTPSGVGSSRNPRRYLRPSDVLRTEIDGLGAIRNECA